MKPQIPRIIDPANTFNALVQWLHDEIIVKRGAPGLLIGLSGTDSVVAFLAAYKAFEKAGKPNRVLGVHFAPSEEFLDDHPEAEVHLWFSKEVIPWLRQQAKEAEIVIDTSIDWRGDGLRWGALADLSVVSNERKRVMRLPEDQFWIVGTRNRSEDTLKTYSNASMLASLQPLIGLWKSEILQISEYLKVPQVAVTKSCETDCICGRMRLPAMHIKEVDTLLMVRRGELIQKYVDDNIQFDLQRLLSRYIEDQIAKSSFKGSIPYVPGYSFVSLMDPLVRSFEDGTLDLKEFNHRKHLYVAWYYLQTLPLKAALERYAHYLHALLSAAGQLNRFNLDLTRRYFERIYKSMDFYDADNFDELAEKHPEILAKITA